MDEDTKYQVNLEDEENDVMNINVGKDIFPKKRVDRPPRPGTANIDNKKKTMAASKSSKGFDSFKQD